jgi:hypothetical protein
MRALFGVVSLLVVLAIVGLLAARQLKTAAGPGTAAQVLGAAPGATVRETSQNAQQKARDDVAKALEQGMAARASSPDQ